MKRALWVIGVFGLCVLAGLGAVQAEQQRQQAPQRGGGAAGDRAAVQAALIANEQKINDAFMKKDLATINSLIAPDGVGVDPMGVSTIGDMLKQLPTMDMKVSNVKLTNHAFHWIDDNTVVMTYTWTGQGTAMGQPVPSPTYASTVWAKKNGKWWAVFHQETPAMPAPKK